MISRILDAKSNELMNLAYQNTFDNTPHPINGDVRFTGLGCEYYQRAQAFRYAGDVAENINIAAKMFPNEKFYVFKHAMDSEGVVRVDVRRVGTYSPVFVGDYTSLRANLRSILDAEFCAEEFKKIVDEINATQL